MKKLLAAVAVCAALVSSVFAYENIVGLTLGYNSYSNKFSMEIPELKADYSEKLSFKGFAIGFQAITMYTDLLGIEADMSLDMASKATLKVSANGESESESMDIKESIGTMFDASVGLAIRPFSTDSFSVFAIPNVGYYVWMPKNKSASMTMNLGVGADVVAMYNVTDNITISAGLDFDYYFTDLLDDTDYPDGVSVSYSMFKPKFGVNLKF